MSKSDTYFQFPIAALQFRKPIDKVTHEEAKSRLHQIVDYCMIEVGTAIVNRDNDDAVAAQCERYAQRHSLKHDKRYKHQSIWLCGADTLNVQIRQVDNRSGKDSWEAISKLQGGRKQVRLKSDYVWEAINGEWNWRDLATLCGVYAGIGAARMARLSFDYIAIMSMGYSSRLELNAAGQSENVLDRRKTGYTVRSLSGSFFVSASPNFRHVYYSHSTDITGLANALVAKQKVDAKPSAKDVTKAIMARTEKPTSTETSKPKTDKPKPKPKAKTPKLFQPPKLVEGEEATELARQRFLAQLAEAERAMA